METVIEHKRSIGDIRGCAHSDTDRAIRPNHDSREPQRLCIPMRRRDVRDANSAGAPSESCSDVREQLVVTRSSLARHREQSRPRPREHGVGGNSLRECSA